MFVLTSECVYMCASIVVNDNCWSIPVTCCACKHHILVFRNLDVKTPIETLILWLIQILSVCTEPEKVIFLSLACAVVAAL